MYCRLDRGSRQKCLEKPEAAQTLIIMKLTFAILLTHSDTYTRLRKNRIKDK